MTRLRTQAAMLSDSSRWPLPRLNRAARLQSDWERQLAETNAIIADIHERQDTIRASQQRIRDHVSAIEASLPLENSNVG